MKGLGVARLGVCILATAVGVSTNVYGQSATVTFYSHAKVFSGFPVEKRGVFYGSVYDGNQPLVDFDAGFFPKDNRFATFSLPPGPHVFSATYDAHPSKKHPYPLTLEAGKQYFLRVRSQGTQLIVLTLIDGRMDEVPCEMAHLETEKAKPLPSKNASSTMAASMVPVTSIPSCP